MAIASVSEASCARCPPGKVAGVLTRIEREVVDSPTRQLRVPTRIQRRTHGEVRFDREVFVDRGVLRDEADVAELFGARRRNLAQHVDGAAVGRQETDGEVQQRRLARAIGSHEANHVPGRDIERAVTERPLPPVALAEVGGVKC